MVLRRTDLKFSYIGWMLSGFVGFCCLTKILPHPDELECGPKPNVMAALPNIGGAPLFNAAEFGWRPLLECRAVTKPKRETHWNLQGCPKLMKRSQPLVGRSSPYYGDMWRRYCCLTSFFPIVNTCLICEDIARQSCGMVPRWRFLATFLPPVFAASRVQQVSDLHFKFAHFTICETCFFAGQIPVFSQQNWSMPIAGLTSGKKTTTLQFTRQHQKALSWGHTSFVGWR